MFTDGVMWRYYRLARRHFLGATTPPDSNRNRGPKGIRMECAGISMGRALIQYSCFVASGARKFRRSLACRAENDGAITRFVAFSLRSPRYRNRRSWFHTRISEDSLIDFAPGSRLPRAQTRIGMGWHH